MHWEKGKLQSYPGFGVVGGRGSQLNGPGGQQVPVPGPACARTPQSADGVFAFDMGPGQAGLSWPWDKTQILDRAPAGQKVWLKRGS